jgi:hypothetical protein
MTADPITLEPDMLGSPTSVQDASRHASEPTAGQIVHSLVIVGFTHPMRACAWRARSAGVRVHLIELVERSRSFVLQSNAFDPDGITLEWSLVGTENGLAAIQRFAQSVQADALLTTDDFTLVWLGKHRGVFEPGCRLLAPDPDVLERLWDKSHQIDRAILSGFELLPGWTLTAQEVIAAIPDGAFPVVIRPSFLQSAQPSFKARILHTRKALSELYSSTHWTYSPIVQRFCLGPNYVLHGVRAQTGELLALQLFKGYRKYEGFATSLMPVPLPESLSRAARRFVEAEGLTGPFHFDLLCSDADDTFYFLEINCRLGGTTGKVMQLGYDEPGLLLACFNTQTPHPLPPLRIYPRTTSIGLNLAQAFNELRNRRDPLAYPQMPRFRSFFAALSEALFVKDGQLDKRDLLAILRRYFARNEN